MRMHWSTFPKTLSCSLWINDKENLLEHPSFEMSYLHLLIFLIDAEEISSPSSRSSCNVFSFLGPLMLLHLQLSESSCTTSYRWKREFTFNLSTSGRTKSPYAILSMWSHPLVSWSFIWSCIQLEMTRYQSYFICSFSIVVLDCWRWWYYLLGLKG